MKATRTGTRVTKLNRAVVIPLPSTTQAGARLSPTRKAKARGQLMALLTKMFGGAVTAPAKGSYEMADGTIMWEDGQTLIMSLCTLRQYNKNEKAIAAFLDGLMDTLDQEAMALALLSAEGSYIRSRS